MCAGVKQYLQDRLPVKQQATNQAAKEYRCNAAAGIAAVPDVEQASRSNQRWHLVQGVQLEGGSAAQVQSIQAVGVGEEASQVATRWQGDPGCRSCGGVQLQQGPRAAWPLTAPLKGLDDQLET